MALPPELSVLCDRCLGRRFVGARGEEVQREAGAQARADHRDPDGPVAEVASKDCAVCEDAFADLDTWVATALEALAAYEHADFQVGTVFPAALEQAEKAAMKAAAGLGHELTDSIRTEANRLLAARITEATGKPLVTEARPDVVVQVDTRFWAAECRANSLFLYGRYTKHRRDVPQTHWPCRTCQGRGCYKCDRKGWQYEDSVEQAIADPAIALFDADGASFHGAGREDIDALMLGTGRPFVLELQGPRKRTVDLDALVAAVNATTAERGTGIVGAMRASSKEEVVALKAGEHGKKYLAHCEADAEVTEDQVRAAAEAMTGAVLQQRTPERVAHRRADKVRERKVHELVLESFDDPRHFSLRVHAESGAYIKEMVSGDDGRTTPSFAGTLGVPVRVAFLDVVAILDAP